MHVHAHVLTLCGVHGGCRDAPRMWRKRRTACRTPHTRQASPIALPAAPLPSSLTLPACLPARPQDVHYKFLSAFLPAFFLRTRDYSKSVTVAPFLVNYSGALFREYPAPWQVLLKQDGGLYAVIAEDRTRYNLGEVKVGPVHDDARESADAVQCMRSSCGPCLMYPFGPAAGLIQWQLPLTSRLRHTP